jgi:stage V sporulation protein D (sporulation-specific penicillin-binding protein)
LGWLQLVEGDHLRQKALEARMRDVPVEAKRGTIFDRNGQELVSSVSVDSAYAFPPQIDDKEAAAEQIAWALDMDKEVVYQKLTQDVGFVWLKRRIDYEASQRLKSLKINGVELVEESQRFYRQDNLAAHVLGFVGDDNQGLTGLESVFDKELKAVIRPSSMSISISLIIPSLRPSIMLTISRKRRSEIFTIHDTSCHIYMSCQPWTEQKNYAARILAA